MVETPAWGSSYCHLNTCCGCYTLQTQLLGEPHINGLSCCLISMETPQAAESCKVWCPSQLIFTMRSCVPEGLAPLSAVDEFCVLWRQVCQWQSVVFLACVFKFKLWWSIAQNLQTKYIFHI